MSPFNTSQMDVIRVDHLELDNILGVLLWRRLFLLHWAPIAYSFSKGRVLWDFFPSVFVYQLVSSLFRSCLGWDSLVAASISSTWPGLLAPRTNPSPCSSEQFYETKYRDYVEDRSNGVGDPIVSSLDCDLSCLPVMVSACFFDATLISGYKYLEWNYK